MQNKVPQTLLMLILLVLLLGLSACGLGETDDPELSAEEIAQTLVAETMAVEYLAQTVAAGTMAAQLTEVARKETEIANIPEPTATEVPATPVLSTPTEAYTATPSVPMVMVSVNTNCREGPGESYAIIGALRVGEQAEVVGVAAEGGYWIIKNPDRAGECWLWTNYATVVGDTDSLPRLTPPPTPTPGLIASPTLTATVTPTQTTTPTISWTGTWTTSHGVTGMMTETLIVTLNQTDNNVSGSVTMGADTVSLSGTLSADYLTLTGTWTLPSVPPTSGPFVFRLLNDNQFVGNRNAGEYEWCGYRAGAGLPDPCMGP